MSGPVRLAVMGDPLRYTRSPDLHRAGAAALGLECESVALRTPPESLAGTLARLASEGYLGCNLTMPLKEPAVALVAEATPAARLARSVNTITFRPEGLFGDTTDGAGFLDLLAELGHDPAGTRVTLLGAGGSARSLAAALVGAGAGITVVSRRRPDAELAWNSAAWCEWGSAASQEAVSGARVLVNATPLAGEDSLFAVHTIARDALVVDLTYGPEPTSWVLAARAHGLAAHDGLGLLVHQARRSLSSWFGREVPLAPLAAAVGWPR